MSNRRGCIWRSSSGGYRRNPDSSASATLVTSGPTITREQAAALKHLISSAVPGMTPQEVTIIDSRHGIVAAEEDQTGADRAAELKRNVERILETHVGSGNAIVEINLDLVTETEQLVEQRIDPDQRAVISQLVEETSDQSSTAGPGPVTAASNLPDGEEAPGDRNETQRAENRQQTNYEVSSVTREISRQPGAIRRVTVAALVNGVVQPDANGDPQLMPRGDAELEVLQELVSSAVGYDETRGDIITVKSLPFAELTQNGTLAQPGLLERLALNELLRTALIGLFTLAILFVVTRALSRRGQTSASTALDNSGAADSSLGMPMTADFSGFYENDETLTNPEQLVSPIPLFDESEQQLALPSGDPVDRLRELMRERQQESAKILTDWIANKENA